MGGYEILGRWELYVTTIYLTMMKVKSFVQIELFLLSIQTSLDFQRSAHHYVEGISASESFSNKRAAF